jgi:N-acetylglucosamine transport system substrate-binding protein
MKVKRRWLMSLLAVVIVLGMLSGCSSKEKAGGNGSSGNGDKSGDGLSGTLEIQYFVGGYGDAWWKDVIKDFKAAHPGLTIKEDAGPNINKEMNTRWISNNPPDVVYIDGAGSSETQMIEDGQLMDLTNWVKTIKLDDGTSLMDSFVVPPSDYDGKIYSLPLVFDTWGTWYDKAWFNKEGFEVPKDFDSWMASMKTIKDKAGIAPFVTTGKYPYYFLRGVLYPAFAAVGGNQLLNDLIDGKKGAWTDERVLGVMEKVQEMQKAGYIDKGFAALNHTQSQMNFLLHKNAFIPVGFWLPNEMKKDVPDGFDFGFIPSPMHDSGTPGVIVPDLRPLAIAKKAKNPEAAKAFVEFAFQKKYAKTFAEMTGAMMNMKGVDLANDSKVPGYLKTANDLINSGNVKVVTKSHPMSADLENPISDILVSLMLGKIDAKEFCQKAEAAAAKYQSSK